MTNVTLRFIRFSLVIAKSCPTMFVAVVVASPGTTRRSLMRLWATTPRPSWREKNAAAILALAFGDISENQTITAVVLRVTGPPITCPV